MGLKNKTSNPSDAGFISQIIFPNNAITELNSQAFLVGWNLENFRCTIACLVELPHEQLHRLESSLVGGSHDLQGMMTSSSILGQTQPVILGEILRNAGEDYVPSAEKQAHSIWITLTLSGDSSKPQLLSLYSLGCKYDTSCYVFGYDPADASELECYHVDRRNIIACEIHDRQRRNSNSQSDMWSQSDLHLIVNHLNTAQELHHRVKRYLTDQGGAGAGSSNALYYTDKSPYRSKLEKYTCTTVASLCMVLAQIVYGWCALLRQVNRALNHKYVLFKLGTGFSQWLGLSGSGGIESGAYSSSQTSPTPNASTNSAILGVTLRDLSLTGAYLAERSSRIMSIVQKCGFFPHAWLLPPALKQHLWIDVHSYLCLLWLDMILGVLFGYIMYIHADEIVHYLQQECTWVQTRVIFDTLEWFNNSPGGVKLNTIITRKFGSLIIAAVKSYDVVMLATEPLHVAVIRLIACFGTFGFTVQLVLIVDISRMVTLHIALIHRALSYLHEFLLQCLHTLWLLFQGQKKNVLRKRIDTCRFGQDQLLFGIVLFTILLFVFPSFAAYYFLFALAQLCCVAFQYLVYSLSVVVKEFPCYEVFLYVLRPEMQSDGVQFKVLPNLAARATAAVLASILPSKTQAPHAKKPLVTAPPVASQRTERTSATVDSNSALPMASPGVAVGFGELRGILKSSDPPLTASAPRSITTTSAVPSSGSSKGRVSFQSSTVRTIPQYHSDENSPNSGEGSGDDHESVPSDATVPLLYRQDFVLPEIKESTERLSGMQQWNKLMSLQQPLQYSGADANHVDSSGNGRSCVAYIELTARVQSKARLFSTYLSHITYLSQERGIAERLLRGVVYGRPALDIQLIHGTSDISDQRESGEQAVLDEIAHILTRLGTAPSSGADQERIDSAVGASLLKDIRVLHGREGSYSQQYFFCISVAVNGFDAVTSDNQNSQSPPRETEENTPLLSEPTERKRTNSLSVLHSRQCRAKSRWMIFLTLLTLIVHFVLCMCGVAIFTHSMRTSWAYQNNGVERSTETVSIAHQGEVEQAPHNHSSHAFSSSHTSMRKLVLAPDAAPIVS